MTANVKVSSPPGNPCKELSLFYVLTIIPYRLINLKLIKCSMFIPLLLAMFFVVCSLLSVLSSQFSSCFRRGSPRRLLCFSGVDWKETLRSGGGALLRRRGARCDWKEQRCSCAAGASTGPFWAPGEAAGGAPLGHSGPLTARCGSPASARAAFERRSELTRMNPS